MTIRFYEVSQSPKRFLYESQNTHRWTRRYLRVFLREIQRASRLKSPSVSSVGNASSLVSIICYNQNRSRSTNPVRSSTTSMSPMYDRHSYHRLYQFIMKPVLYLIVKLRTLQLPNVRCVSKPINRSVSLARFTSRYPHLLNRSPNKNQRPSNVIAKNPSDSIYT